MLASTLLLGLAFGQTPEQPLVTVSGRVLDPQGMNVPGAEVRATDGIGRIQFETKADERGQYALQVAPGRPYVLVAVSFPFESVATNVRQIDADVDNWDLSFGALQRVSDVVTVTASIIEPTVDRRDEEIFTRTLFTRDDQIFQTLGAGLNLGQHAGGGKSLEIRRFGFNLDHGGAGGGLKVLRDNIAMNDVSGGHAHGYLGAMKGLSPELVEDVNLINGPFNAQYGDFSALGVVNVATRREMPDRIMARAQIGQFNTRRFFGSYSPEWRDHSGLIAIESSYSDGPFLRALEYKRNNLTGAFSRRLNETDRLTFRFYGSTNDYFSPGQIPIDEVEAGRLDRYGYIDPTEGGDEFAGTLAAYWARENADGSALRFDGMVNRARFNLYSNFTFFLDHPVNGDAITQFSDRWQQAGNAQYVRPHTLGGGTVFGTFTSGANLLGNQVYLSLAGRQNRAPTDLRTAADVNTLNSGFYAQENLIMMGGKLRLDLGLRYDAFFYRTANRLEDAAERNSSTGFFQPKVGLAYTPKRDLPVTLHANYGRAITTVDGRSLIEIPNNPLAATTDFYQVGASHNIGRYSFSTSAFWIDRSNEFVYVADAGITELGGPTRSYGFEAKTSVQLSRSLAFNASIAKVLNSFYRATDPREYIIRAPHFTGYVGLTASNWKGWSGSIRMRAINHYTLTNDNAISAPGYTVFDLSLARPLNRWLELNFAMDNVFDRSYYETLALYESRLAGQDPIERIHATTGYPRTIMGGVTIRLFPKN